MVRVTAPLLRERTAVAHETGLTPTGTSLDLTRGAGRSWRGLVDLVLADLERAARLIEEHCAEPLGTPDVAEAVHLSVRALQAGFQAHLGATPMAYLRRVRLERVRESLSDGSAASVTEAALRWGVTHLGRLSGDYRDAFGETPSDTLRRSR